MLSPLRMLMFFLEGEYLTLPESSFSGWNASTSEVVFSISEPGEFISEIVFAATLDVATGLPPRQAPDFRLIFPRAHARTLL